MNNFITRTLSGLILVNIMIISVFNIISFNILIFFIMCCMLYEWFNITKSSIMHTIIGITSILAAILSLSFIHSMTYLNNSFIILGYFILIWSVDTFAMIFGKIIKGPKLSPKISPNKTWSGLIFGVIFSSINVLLLNYLTAYSITNYYKISINMLTMIVCILSIIAQMSDLFVSYFKRKHHVKDSGFIIPGHGGVLDRFDSIILTAPILLLFNILI